MITRHTTTYITADGPLPSKAPSLGPLDQVVPVFIPIAVAVIFAKDPSAKEDPISTDLLRFSLERILPVWSILSGRLVQQDDASYQVEHLDKGAALILASCDENLAEFGSSDELTLNHFPNGSKDLFAPYDMMRATEEPNLSIQHTRFACGGASLGIRIPHRICDAEGFFHFLRDLAKAYDSDSQSPGHLPRPISAAYTPPPSTSTPISHIYTIDPPPSSTPSGTNPPVTGRFLRLSPAQLSQLKAMAQGDDPASRISTFDALSAFLFQRVHVARKRLRELDPTVPSLSPPNFLTSVSLRPLLSLSDRYVNNALSTPYFQLESQELLDWPLPKVAQHLHKVVRSLTREEVIDSVRFIDAQSDKSKIRSGFLGGTCGFMASQWSRLSMYPAFGGVRPILVSTPFTEISLVDGLTYFLPDRRQGTTEERGELEVCLSLSDPLWSILEQDRLWRQLILGV